MNPSTTIGRLPTSSIAPTVGPRPVVSCVARRSIPKEEAQPTLFTLGHYLYRAWVTNLSLTPAGVRHFYDDRAAMEIRIAELREDYTLRKIRTRSFPANAPLPGDYPAGL